MTEVQEREVQEDLRRLARTCQQEFYECMSDFNSYKPNELNGLYNFIGFTLFGLPESLDCDTCDYEYVSVEDRLIYPDKQAKTIQYVYNQLEEQWKIHNLEELYCGVVYNIIVPKANATKSSFNSEMLHVVPVFRLKTKAPDMKRSLIPYYAPWLSKVYKPLPQLTDEYSVVYVDTTGRVYKNWNDYLENNMLPKCLQITPKNGHYQADPSKRLTDKESHVFLEYYWTTSCKISYKVASCMDAVGAVVGIGAIVVSGAAVFTPVGPALLLGSAVSGAASSAWTMGRSTQELTDRYSHNQSLANTEAIGSWLGVVGSGVGLAASGASSLLSRAIQRGTTISRAAELTHDALQLASAMVNGTGIGLRVYQIVDKYNQTKEISVKDVLFLTMHMFQCYNSVINMKSARTMIQAGQANIIESYEQSLRSNRHRKEFKRLVANTSDNDEIIRSINKITNKDDFFAAVIRNRKHYKGPKGKISFSDGKAVINDVVFVDPVSFSNASAKLAPRAPQNVIGPVAAASTSSIGLAFKLYREFSMIIQNFCVRYARELGYKAIGKLRDYVAVLSDIQRLPENLNMLWNLLHCAKEILNRMDAETVKQIRLSKRNMKNLLAQAVEYIWFYVKAVQSHQIRFTPEETLNKMIYVVFQMIIGEADPWVKGFIAYLQREDEAPLIDLPIINEPVMEPGTSQRSELDIETLSMRTVSIDDMELEIIEPEAMEVETPPEFKILSPSNFTRPEDDDLACVENKVCEESCTTELYSATGRVLRDFRANYQGAIPRNMMLVVSDFKCVLGELACYTSENQIATIFHELLKSAAIIASEVCLIYGDSMNLFAACVKFLWEFVKANVDSNLHVWVTTEDNTDFLHFVVDNIARNVEINKHDFILAFNSYCTNEE